MNCQDCGGVLGGFEQYEPHPCRENLKAKIARLKELLKNLAAYPPIDECGSCECCQVRVVQIGSGKPLLLARDHKPTCPWRLAKEEEGI